MDRERIKNWFRNNDNKILFCILALAILIRIYYFFKLGSQPIWWDEGDYLSIPKVWSLSMAKPEWWSHFTGMRPLLMPIIWFFFMKLNLGELVMRFFTLLVPSILTVYLVYAVARDMYNKKIALISGFIMSVYWVHLFYTFRLLTDIPALFLGMLTIYYFYSVYIIKGEKKGLYLSILFGVLAFAARFPHASVLFTCFLFLFLIQKTSFFKSRLNWKAIFILFLLLSPYIIYFVYNNFYAFQFYLGPTAASIKTPYPEAIKNIFGLFPFLFSPSQSEASSIFTNIFLIFLFFGIFSLYELFLGFDILWKQQDKKLNADFFIFLWIIIQLVVYVIVIRAANDRWLLMLMPALFILIAKGFYVLAGYLKKYSRELAVFIAIALVLIAGYQQLKHSDWLINIKKTSYQEEKDAGLWLKINTPKDAKIITASIVQNQYYSERQSYDFYTNDTYLWQSSCPDNINMNDSCSIITEASFNKKLARLNPDYMIVSAFEPYFTPKWAYTYPQRYNLTFVNAYPANTQQPLLVVYKFNK